MAVQELRTLVEGLEVEAALGPLGDSGEEPEPDLGGGRRCPPRPGLAVDCFGAPRARRKWSGATFADHGSWVMGAPEMLTADSDPSRAVADEMAAGGRGCFWSDGCWTVSRTPDRGAGEVQPVALVAINQQLRPDAADTVAYFLDQGVTVKVISGDNAVTVGAIAEQAGIPLADDPFDARHLPEDTAELAEVLETHGGVSAG